MSLLQNYSTSLENYRQNGDICAYLNITKTTKNDVENLADKLNALDIYQGNNKSFLTIYLPTIAHQIIVGECSYIFRSNDMTTQAYYNNTLIYYDEFNFIKPIIPWLVIPGIFTIISIILNISLIFVSIRKIPMVRICNLLILFEAFFQILSVSPFAVNFISFILNFTIIDWRICFCFHLISTIGSFSSFLAIYFISMERALIIFYPTKIHKIRTSTIRRISYLMFIICIIFGIIMVLIQFNVWTVLNLPYYKIFFCNSGLYSDILYSIPSYFILSASSFNYFLIFCSIYWSYLKSKEKNKKTNQQNQPSITDPNIKILRSVFVISFIIIFGWIIGSAARNGVTTLCTNIATGFSNLFKDVQGNPSQTVYDVIRTSLISFVTCINPISAGINSVILIISNSEYRNAYNKAFGIKQQISINSVGPYFTNQRN
ncbi:hypothetical protein ACQ4LE_010077 [Meloidogyne hapla]